MRTKKYGKRKGKQRYRCNNCAYVFKNARRYTNKINKRLWFEYSFQKQTYCSLAEKYNTTPQAIQRRLDTVEVVLPRYTVHPTIILMDTSYFPARTQLYAGGGSFGVMVFRDYYRKENILWKYVNHERLEDYINGINELKVMGWDILGIVCDGKRGLFKAFGTIPIQMCQYHQAAIVTRYITKNPKLEAGKELKELMKLLTITDKESFTGALEEWHYKWNDFLKEKTFNPETNKYHFTHRRIRSAYRSLKTNLPYLYTWYDHIELNMPNTTNSIEGTFSNTKNKVRVHAGLKKHRKIKLINQLVAK